MNDNFPKIKDDPFAAYPRCISDDQRDAAVILAGIISKFGFNHGPDYFAQRATELLRALQAELKKNPTTP